jgi:hypothetical protein
MIFSLFGKKPGDNANSQNNDCQGSDDFSIVGFVDCEAAILILAVKDGDEEAILAMGDAPHKNSSILVRLSLKQP